MTIVINPKYEHLHAQLEHIDQLFQHAQGDLCFGKDTIRVVNIDETDFCVKHYAKNSLPSRIAVKLFKSSNGKKAYLNAALLRERGFIAQEPVAYISYPNNWVDASTYFICLHSKFPHTLLDIQQLDKDEQDLLIKDLAHYAALLHHQGFSHQAFHADNILFEKKEDHYNFSILDTNGLKLGKPLSVIKGCENLALLQGDAPFFDKLSKAYAQKRNADPELCKNIMIEKHRECFSA